MVCFIVTQSYTYLNELGSHSRVSPYLSPSFSPKGPPCVFIYLHFLYFCHFLFMDEVIFHLLHGPFLHLLSLGAQHIEDLGKQGPTCSFLLTHKEDDTFMIKLLLIV